MMMGAAMEKLTMPVADTACSTPTDAEELCSSAVTSAPNSTPSSGFSNMVNNSWNQATSRSCPSTFSMVVMPTNRMPKPISSEAKSLIRLRLDTSIMAAPMAMNTGANDEGLSRDIQALESPDISPSRRICPVMVVPMLAPIMTGTACVSFMMPAFKKPSTMTEVAAEL